MEAAQASLSLHLSKCHIVGNHMSQLICRFVVSVDGTEQDCETAANCLWLVTNSKPCPNCRSPIQKNEGCNHMKCSKVCYIVHSNLLPF